MGRHANRHTSYGLKLFITFHRVSVSQRHGARWNAREGVGTIVGMLSLNHEEGVFLNPRFDLYEYLLACRFRSFWLCQAYVRFVSPAFADLLLKSK